MTPAPVATACWTAIASASRKTASSPDWKQSTIERPAIDWASSSVSTKHLPSSAATRRPTDDLPTPMNPASAIGRRPRRLSRSDRKEHRFPIALEVDVVPELPGAIVRCHQCRPCLGILDQVEHRIDRVGSRFVREVQARDQLAQETPSEDGYVEVGRLSSPVWRCDRSRLQKHEVESALGVGAAACERVRLPGLDEGVWHRVAGTVEHLAFDAQRAGGSRVDRVCIAGEWQRKAEERTYRLRRRRTVRHRQLSIGVAERPRITMSHRYPRAHSGSVVSKSK